MTTPLQIELTVKTGLTWQSDTPGEYYAWQPGKFQIWYYYPQSNYMSLQAATVSQVFLKHVLRHKGMIIRPDVAQWRFAPNREYTREVRTIPALVKTMDDWKKHITHRKATPDDLVRLMTDQAARFLPYFKRLDLASVDTDPTIDDMAFIGAGGCTVTITRSGKVRMSMNFSDTRQSRLADLVAPTAEIMAGDGMRISFILNDLQGHMGVDTYRSGTLEEVLHSLEKYLSTPIGKLAMVKYNEQFTKMEDAR